MERVEQRRGSPSRATAEVEARSRSLLREQADRTLVEAQRGLGETVGVRFSIQHLWRVLRRTGLQLKKFLHAREQYTPEAQQHRQAWREAVSRIDPARLVFVDESGVTTEMTRRYGRAPRGELVREATPGGHWRTLTLLGVMSAAGMVATMTVESPTDGEVFLAYVEQVLCPRLQPVQIVILDNLGAHKVAGGRELIEATGAALLYLPPYSPDFNPIGQCWSNVKQKLRSLKARTLESLQLAVSEALYSITADNASAWFSHCGYAIH